LDPQQVASRATGHFQPYFPSSRPVNRPVFASNESSAIELQSLTDGTASKTVVKNKKLSTTVIEVGGEMKIKTAHTDAVSMTKCSEVKSRFKRITDDTDWRTKVERGHRIFERIRVRTDKVAKSAQEVPVLCEYLSTVIDQVLVGEREGKRMFDNRVRISFVQ
jgi:hypothetical protein